MDSNDITKEFKNELVTTLQSTRRGGTTYERRRENIAWIDALPIEGLQYGQTEMRIPIVETTAGERIVIQYPGKESTPGKRRKWSNPRDFRPKILKPNSIDLTFEQIWDPLFDNLRSVGQANAKWIATSFATILYRMAFMLDFDRIPGRRYEMMPIINEAVLDSKRAMLTQALLLGPLWVYRPPARAVNAISKVLPDWAGMSFEAFLHYNNLLAWNEDYKCRVKYNDWNPADSRGRINTLLTHVRVIGFILNEVRPSSLMHEFALRRGMSPAQPNEVLRICSPFISEQPQ